MLPHSIGLAMLTAFGIGIITFIGPCAPSRLCVVRNDDHSKAMRDGALYTLASGLGFATLGAIGSWLFIAIFTLSPYMYAILAIVSIVAGTREILHIEHIHDGQAAKTTGSLIALFSGYASAWTLAPCCTPIITAAIGLTASPLQAALVLGSYGLGHSLPILGLQNLAQRISRPALRQTIALATGGLGIALGLYYGILI